MLRNGILPLVLWALSGGLSRVAAQLGGDFLGLDGSHAGVPAFSFLKLPISARSIGLGGRTLTTDEEASLVHGNPASLSLVENYYYSVSHAEILGEFRHEDLAFAFPTRLLGSFGMSANILTTTAFEDARDIDENPDHPSAYDMALGFAYGQTLWQGRVAMGGRLDLIRSSMDGTLAHGYGVNMGMLFFLVNDIRLGIALQNLSHGVRYNSAGAPLEPMPMGMGWELGKPLLGTRWSAHLGFLKNNEGLLQYYGGGEFSAIRFLVLRAGYDGSSQDRELGAAGGMAAGVGMKFDLLTLDYGFKSLGPLGAYHALTLNYSRKARFRNRDEVLLEQALGQYRKGKYGKAMALARKAVAANPYNFKAQAMVRQLQLDMERVDETAFALFYTGGNEGALTSLWKDGHAFGGLARRKTKLVELKGLEGKSLILDAGEMTRPAASLGQERYVHEAYARMPYDALNVGRAELLLGAEKRDGRLPWLASQKPLDGGHGIPLGKKTLRLKGDVEVTVLGAVDPGSVRNEALGGRELEGIAEAVKRHGAEGGGHSVRVLLLAGELAAAQRLVSLAPGLDVIILSGEKQALGSPMKMGNTLVCSPGRGGTHIGNLTLVLDPKGKIRSFRHHLIPLDASIPEDADLRKFLEPVTVDPNKIALDDYDEDYRAQVMAFIHDPPAGAAAHRGRLFLRDLRSGRDYPIATGNLACSRPLLGYGKNKVAFLGRDSAGAQEIYTAEPGTARLDTLTRMGGTARDISWILHNNALLALYEKDGQSELYRIDPWSREVRNQSKGRFGRVRGFDVVKSGDRLALIGSGDGGSTLWVTALDLSSPLPVVEERAALAMPRWNPKGDRLAFLALSPDDNAAGELRIFDFVEKKMIPVTLQSRVRDFAWSADGSRIYYAAGVNLVDLNEYHLDSLYLRRVTAGTHPDPRSEEAPFPKVFGEKAGLIFEAAAEGRRRILWLDLTTKEERVLVDSAGYNSLR